MEWQAGWLLRAVTCIDLNTLSGDDTETNVKRLCFKAKNPIRKDILEKLGCENIKLTTGAICVYPSRVPDAVKHLQVRNFLCSRYGFARAYRGFAVILTGF